LSDCYGVLKQAQPCPAPWHERDTLAAVGAVQWLCWVEGGIATLETEATDSVLWEWRRNKETARRELISSSTNSTTETAA
jgi:hypothetical protein